MKFLAIALVVLAIGVAVRGVRQNRRHNVKRKANGMDTSHSTAFAAIVVSILLLLGGFVVWRNATPASAQTTQPDAPKETPDASTCADGSKPQVASPKVDFGQDNSNSQLLAASGGDLVGNGPALDTSSTTAAVTDLYTRTEYNPKLTADLAYVVHADGFVPDTPLGDADAVQAYINQQTARLYSNHDQWSAARLEVCKVLMSPTVTLDSSPYKDKDLYELATRAQDTKVGDVKLPVTSVALSRPSQGDVTPDGVNMLWIYQGIDTSGERPNPLPVGVDTQYAWPAIVGAAPAGAETCKPVAQQPTAKNQQKQQNQEQANASASGGNGSGSSHGGGGNGGGSNGNCGGSCTGGSGGNGGGNCGCTSTTGPPPTTCHCTTPTTSPPTTGPPRTTPTTSPPPTTTPPTTTPPTTTPPTTSPPTTKAPDPGVPTTVCYTPYQPGC